MQADDRDEGRAGLGSCQSLKQDACSGGGTHHGSGVLPPHCPTWGEQLLQFFHVHTLFISASLCPSGPIQCQEARIPWAPGALRRGELVFYILTQEDPKAGGKNKDGHSEPPTLLSTIAAPSPGRPHPSYPGPTCPFGRTGGRGHRR